MKNSRIIKVQNFIKDNENNFKQYYDKTISNLKANNHLNASLEIIENYKYAQNNPNSKINKILYAVKDNINVLDSITTGGSLFFKNYKSPYSATVIECLDKAGAIPICKANLDEFGLGGTGLYSAYGYVKNPYDETRISAGSSSGSAVLVAKDLVTFALGTDTGDSIRMPASYLGIYGYKPTYGLISRYGVFPYSPSLDHVGLLTNSVYDIALVMDYINEHDKKDFTSQITKLSFLENINNINNEWKIGYFENIVDLLGPKEKALYFKIIDILSETFNIEKSVYPIELVHLIPRAYEILSYSEAVSCYQNITGIPFGEKGNFKDFKDKVIDIRTKSFGTELKRRFVLGSYCTLENNYEGVFLKCKKIRRLLVETMDLEFEKYDFFIMPGSATIAPKIDDVINGRIGPNDVDNYLQIANMGGYPSITIPMGKIDNMPIGINIMGKINSDEKLLALASKIDELIRGTNYEK